jgi:hypothetical protein
MFSSAEYLNASLRIQCSGSSERRYAARGIAQQRAMRKSGHNLTRFTPKILGDSTQIAADPDGRAIGLSAVADAPARRLHIAKDAGLRLSPRCAKFLATIC